MRSFILFLGTAGPERDWAAAHGRWGPPGWEKPRSCTKCHWATTPEDPNPGREEEKLMRLGWLLLNSEYYVIKTHTLLIHNLHFQLAFPWVIWWKQIGNRFVSFVHYPLSSRPVIVLWADKVLPCELGANMQLNWGGGGVYNTNINMYIMNLKGTGTKI